MIFLYQFTSPTFLVTHHNIEQVYVYKELTRTRHYALKNYTNIRLLSEMPKS